MRQSTSVQPDRGTYPVGDSIRDELNQLIQDFNYIEEHRLLATGTVTIGTTTTRARTTAVASYLCAGDVKTKAATDDLFILGGADSNTNVAIGFFQKYLLYLDAAGAATVQEGVQAATAAAVTFAARPPAGKTVIGVLTVQNASGAAFDPGTTALNAAGITTTYKNGIDASMLRATTLDR